MHNGSYCLNSIAIIINLLGRKRRGIDYAAAEWNQTRAEDAALLNTFIQAHDITHTNIHKDMVARYSTDFLFLLNIIGTLTITNRQRAIAFLCFDFVFLHEWSHSRIDQN